MRIDRLPISVLRTRYVPGGWDVLAFVLVFAFFIYLAQAAHGLTGSLTRLEATPISLAPAALFGYAARTALRMLSRCWHRSCSRSPTRRSPPRAGARK
jgi:hypothetical protein